MTDGRKRVLRAIEEDVPLGELEALIGYNLKRAYVIVRDDFRRTLGEDGFAPRVFSAMALIVEFPNITQSELARMLGLERSGLVAIIDELEARGFAHRNSVPGDRRVQALSPSTAGKEAFAKAQKAIRAHEDSLLSHFSESERETLLNLLRKIRQVEK